jgi:hypothetical protein
MKTKRLVTVATIATVYFSLAVVSPPVFVFLSLAALWGGLWIGIRLALRWWKQLPFLQKAQYISEIRRVDYFRRVSGPQLENWVLLTFTARGYVLLGDPVLGRSLPQGCAWIGGKKTSVVMQQDRPLTERDLQQIYTAKNRFKVEKVIVLSPFPNAPESNLPGLEILAGKKFLSWMSVLDGVRPVLIDRLPPQNCSCGCPQHEYVSRAGESLLICSRYPDCQKAPRSGVGSVLSAENALRIP